MLRETQEAYESCQTSPQNSIKTIITNWPINGSRVFSSDPFKYKRNMTCRDRLTKVATGILGNIAIDTSFFIGSHPKSTKIITSLLDARRTGYVPEINDLSTINHMLSAATNLQTIFGGNELNAMKFKMAFRALEALHQIWQNHANPHELNVPLMMAALEEIIADGLGLPFAGGCKSSKDRRAAQLMMKSSLLRFMATDDCVPNIQNKDHAERLSDYFADFFLPNHHQQAVSVYCSSGVIGIQNGRGFSPEFLPQMIPDIVLKNIGEKLSPDDAILSDKEKIARGKAEISRQHAMGKTAAMYENKDVCRTEKKQTGFFLFRWLKAKWNKFFGTTDNMEEAAVPSALNATAETLMAQLSTDSAQAEERVELTYRPAVDPQAVGSVEELKTPQTSDRDNAIPGDHVLPDVREEYVDPASIGYGR